jgi:hypothetical protein
MPVLALDCGSVFSNVKFNRVKIYFLLNLLELAAVAHREQVLK